MTMFNVRALPIPIEVALDFADDSYTQKTVKVGDAECWVTEHGRYQIVAPRGTEFSDFFSEAGWLDVLSDAAAWPWYHRHIGWGHFGFMAGAKGLVKHGLRGLLRKEEPIILIGHSLGGGYAIGIALLLSALGFRVEGVITFGCPKALYSKKAIKRFWNYKIPVWQFSNPGDPVTDVPVLLGRHVNEIKTDRKADGYRISTNHMIEFYREAFK